MVAEFTIIIGIALFSVRTSIFFLQVREACGLLYSPQPSTLNTEARGCALEKLYGCVNQRVGLDCLCVVSISKARAGAMLFSCNK